MVNPYNLSRAWNYSGDINLECGGFFWQFDGPERFPECDYVRVVRVTPCSDAGGPDNLFHVESGSLYMPRDTYGRALETCGYSLETNLESGALMIDDCMGVSHDIDSEHGAALLVDAFNGYSGPDRDALGGETVVRIGRPDPYFDDTCGAWNPDPDIILRGNASLARYIAREFLV